jgi:hypothetical protein
LLAVAGALLRYAPLAVLALRRVACLASHPATAAKLHKLFLRGARAQVLHDAELLAHALDPCVAYQIEVDHA